MEDKLASVNKQVGKVSTGGFISLFLPGYYFNKAHSLPKQSLHPPCTEEQWSNCTVLILKPGVKMWSLLSDHLFVIRDVVV